MAPNAYVLKVRPSLQDYLSYCLQNNVLVVGWSEARELINLTDDWEQFRNYLRDTYSWIENNRSAGIQGSSLWAFLASMQKDDYVVVPGTSQFYVGRVASEARHEPEHVTDDTAHRRDVEWLNSGAPIDRNWASSALQSRMKARQACVYADDLVPDIEMVLDAAKAGARPDFYTDLRVAMIERALERLRSPQSVMNDWEFERLVENLLRSMGADSVEITGRPVDQGDDVVAKFSALDLTVVCQVKYHRDPSWKTDVSALHQLLRGMEKRQSFIGWLITCGEFDEGMEQQIQAEEEAGRYIRTIDGHDLAALLVDQGMADLVVERAS